MSKKTIPKKLYKYRGFSTTTLGLIVNAEAYYANPRSFNDPLDCSPTLDADIGRAGLERLHYRMLLQKGRSEGEATGIIEHFRYLTSEYGDYRTDPDTDKYLADILSREILDDVTAEMGAKGVLSFAATWESPLMWSHYGEEHRGICIEYVVGEVRDGELGAVNYKAGRAIKASDVRRWKIDGDRDAKSRVEQTYFFAKAAQWRYEREWRHVTIGSGLTWCPFAVSAIYFGFRCPDAVRVTIVKLLSGERDIKLYELRPYRDTFRFKRYPVERDEIEATGIRPAMLNFFEPIGDAVDDPISTTTSAQASAAPSGAATGD